MVGAVEERHLDVHHREPGEDPRLERLADARVNRLDVLARDGAADDPVHELVAGALLVGLQLDHGVAVLALATRLPDEAAVAFRRTADGLAVGDLRLADVGGDPELPDHAVHEHVEVELAHARDERLGRLRVGLDAEGGVLLGEPLEGDRELVLVGLRLRLDLHLDDRLGEGHRLEDDGMVGVAQRVAGVGVLEPDGRGDVPRIDLVDLLAVVGVHLQDAPDALLAVLGRVVDVRAGLQRARVDAEEGELAHERVGRDLEGKGGERLLVVDGAQDLRARGRVQADDWRHVERRGQVVDDRVEHGLDALVAQCRAGQDRDDPILQRPQAEAALDLLDAEVVALKVLVRQVVVHLGDGVDHRRAVLLGLCAQLGRDVHDLDLVAQVVAEVDGLHPDEVDDALEGVLAPDRDLHRHRVGAEALADRVDTAPEVRAGAVELVDEAEARHAVAIRLAPDRLRLRLDAGHAVEDDHRAVEHAEAALHLDREVHVPGRIDDVDAMLAPERGRGRGRDGDAALLLLRHPVHRGRALMDLAELVDLLRVEEDALGDGRLPGVDMRDDADVPRLGQRNAACHGLLSSLLVAYHLKWLKALLASAILWVSSRRLTAAPSPFMASTSSAASFSLIDLPERLRADCTNQRTPSDMRRSPRISTGTW